VCSSQVRGEKNYTPAREPHTLKPKFVKVGPAAVRPQRTSNSEGVQLGEGFGVLELGARRKTFNACSWAPRLEAKLVKVAPAAVRPRRTSNSVGLQLGESFGVLEPGARRKKIYAFSWAPHLEAIVC